MILTVIEELNDGLPAVSVVYVVSEARCVDNGQPHYSGQCLRSCRSAYSLPLKNFSSSSAFVISISTVLSTCFACRLL